MAEESVEVWKKRFERERQARKNAEELLEEKSREIYHINQSLEKTVDDRTHALSAALVQAKEANRAKDTFLSNMSHDLRTPLNAIIGFSQILLAKKDLSDASKQLIEKIYLSGNNLLSLVNTILDLSKIDAGKMEVHKVPFALHDLVREVLIMTEPMMQKKTITVETNIKDNVLLMADRQLIKQVLLNLLSNAIKFSPSGTIIEIVHEEKDPVEVISVKDHGPGIPGDKIQALFDPFFQIQQQQDELIKGTGLGLSIVKKIVELHEGTINVESVVGEGSSFRFSIPRFTSVNR